MAKKFGEVPKLAEGTPLERVQVVNSGARVQIPPSALAFLKRNAKQKEFEKIQKKLLTKQTTCAKMNKLLQRRSNRTLTNKQQCNPERFLINEMKGHLIWKKFREQNLKQ